jgi:nucleoside diphosphate kinase
VTKRVPDSGEIPLADGSMWQESIFCLVSPDSVRRQCVEAILQRLREAGFTAEGWLEVRLGGRQIDAVAEIQNAGAGDTFRYRALDALFALGPAIALRLHDEVPRSAAERYAVLHSLKGGTPPRSVPGSIRHEVGSVNAVLSLLHISDSPANSEQESAAMLGRSPSFPAFHEASSLIPYLSALARTQLQETRGYGEVLVGVRGRIVARLWHQLGEGGRKLAGGLIERGELDQPDAGARILAEAGKDAAGHPLAPVLAHAFDPSSPALDMAELNTLLRLHGCECDAWETVVLATSQYFEPVRTKVDAWTP